MTAVKKKPFSSRGRLPNWIVRVDKQYHKIARRFKDRNIPYHSTTNCFEEAHCNFVPLTYFKNETAKIKADHGFHCSLYDVYELYLFYVMEFE